MRDIKFHNFYNDVSQISLPQKFTYPFCYTPHPLCVLAKNIVMDYLSTNYNIDFQHFDGKMFGVLIVKDKNENLGFLAAFSGNFQDSDNHEYFVPPIYNNVDALNFLTQGEKKVSEISNKILQIEKSEDYIYLKNKYLELKKESEKDVENYKILMQKSKQQRDNLRLNKISLSDQEKLLNESRFQKAELKRIKKRWELELENFKIKLDNYSVEIDNLKTQRKTLSSNLQTKLFDKYLIYNALEQIKTLTEIFLQTSQQIPPSGAGDCAAPKLLQYAYLQHYMPIAMAEFWVGNSPKTILRRHGNFYPACVAKCRPILNFMLQGLDIEPNPLQKNNFLTIEIVYNDDYLVVINKPAGLQSVPGKLDVDCAYNQAKKMFPNVENLFIVHRLDMATSGLIIMAKSKEIYQKLQFQFKNKTVKKRYISLLDGKIKATKGEINLPICCNPDDRPRQIVDFKFGKPAVTRYEVSQIYDNKTRIIFYPQTGRTHQLRVHSAHPLGLNCPILGDALYGKPAERMFLHAEAITFFHPVFLREISVEKLADF